MPLNYKELSDKAFKLHSENKYKEAEDIYRYLLSVNPNDVNILNLFGLLCLSTNKTNEAIDVLTKAFILKKSSYISSNLGKAYYMNKQYENAVKIYKESLKLEKNDDIYYSLGIAYKALNKYDEAIEAYINALKINPQKYNALYNLSAVYKEKGDIVSAIKYAEKCLEYNIKDESLFTLLYGYYEENNEPDKAILMLKAAIGINPLNYVYFYNLGVLYSKKDNIEEAIINYKKSIELNKLHVESYVNIATLYKGQSNEEALNYLKIAYSLAPKNETVLLSLAQTYKDLFNNEKSLEIIENIINLNPNCAEAYSLAGVNYMDKEQYIEALNAYNKALEISPDNQNYMHGKAIALKYLGRLEDAKEILEEIVKNPNAPVQSQITLGMMYLTEKNFEKGMKLYSVRSNESKLKTVFSDKIWNNNTDITNKNVLIYTDCGLGDTIMFSRYLNFIEKKVKSQTLQTDYDLVNILKENFPNINIIKKSITPPEYDVVIPIMDLPIVLNLDFNNIPNSQGYLKINTDKFNNIEEFENQNKKVGLFWQGNKKIFKNRSIPFELMCKLFKHKDISFYSFQIDKEYNNEGNNIINLSKYITDYYDTAALLKNMDLLITIDSSIAHMAGALGIKTYLLLPKTAEWRWFNDEEKTPWYNSVKIFRQKNISDWDEVINRVDKEL